MKKKTCLCFAAALAAACLLTGCGSSYSATEEAAGKRSGVGGRIHRESKQ